MKDDDFVPYGPEWEKEVMKFPKAHLVDLLREKLMKDECQPQPDINKWFNGVVDVEKFKAGVPTFTALEVLKLLTRFYSSIRYTIRKTNETSTDI